MNPSFISRCRSRRCRSRRCRSRRCRGVASKREAKRPLKISDRADLRQTRVPHQLHHETTLVVVVFNQKPAPGSKPGRPSIHNSSDRIQTVLSPTQGQMRFMVPNNGVETLNHRPWDVRRIADHQIQASPPAPQGRPPRPEVKSAIVTRGATLKIAFRQAQSFGAEIDAMPRCRRPSASQTHGDGPRTSAEVSPTAGEGSR